MIRANFSDIEKRSSLHMRRMKPEEVEEAGIVPVGNIVGIFAHPTNHLIGIVDFDDIFDNEGNRFNND